MNIVEKDNLRVNLSKILLSGSTLVLFISIFFRLYCSNKVAVQNEDLKELFLQKEKLEKEISTLEYIDNDLSSLVNLEEKAKTLGFVEFEETLLTIDTKAPVPVASLSN